MFDKFKSLPAWIRRAIYAGALTVFAIGFYFTPWDWGIPAVYAFILLAAYCVLVFIGLWINERAKSKN